MPRDRSKAPRRTTVAATPPTPSPSPPAYSRQGSIHADDLVIVPGKRGVWRIVRIESPDAVSVRMLILVNTRAPSRSLTVAETQVLRFDKATDETRHAATRRAAT